MMEQSTRTDLDGWGVNDAVVQLREWGSQRLVLLPPTPTVVTVGSSSACTFRLHDPSVSREHLQLSYIDGRWMGVDRDSKNGTCIDGVRTQMFSLTPGCEIRAGGVTLVAESQQWIQLRQFLRRILGYGEDKSDLVDHALRSIRQAALGHGVLYLSGAGDLVQIAGSLHRYVWGKDRPFVTADPRRNDVEESVRSVANKTTGMEALAVSHRGTLCIRAERPPEDFDEVLAHIDRPVSRVLLAVVGTDRGTRYTADATTNPSIHIPALDRRMHELSSVIDEYITDAAEELRFPRSLFTDEDRQWVRENAASSIPSIETATLRLLALRGSRNFSGAAARLRMAPVSLTRWFDRRSLPASLAAKRRPRALLGPRGNEEPSARRG